MAIKILTELNSKVVLAVFLFLGLLILIGNTDAKDLTAASGSAADIQIAVDSVYTSGGGTVHIPPGTYHHNRVTIKVKDGVSLIGAGKDKTIITAANIR